MKKCLFSLFLSLFYLISFEIVGQEYCGTEISKDQIISLENSLKESGRLFQKSVNVQVEIPIKFHSFRRSDGTGGISREAALVLIEQVNQQYANADIIFYLLDEINYIDDTELFNFESNFEGQATVGNTIANVINLYLFNSISSNGRALCGYTNFPPSADRVFVAYNCVLNGNTTLEHELGHYFTLYHTHGTTNTGTTDELVNGSNCETAGDRLCDTPADPNLSGLVNSSCAYLGNLRDANGDFYVPDPSNIMSYSIDDCQDYLSSQQFQRIREGFEKSRGYLNFTTENFIATFASVNREICIDQGVKFNSNSFGATEFNWQFEGGTPATSTEENPEIMYKEGGVFDVILTVFNNSGQSYTVSRPNYIRVKDPLTSAFDQTFNLDLSSPAQFNTFFSVENNDQSITFEYDSILLENELQGVVTINNYDYLTESLPQKDRLFSKYFKLEGAAKYKITFDYAYAFRANESGIPEANIYDSLAIYLEIGCNDLTQNIFYKGGQSLSTTEGEVSKYKPQNSDEFVSVELDFIPEKGQEFFRFMFENISYNGNNFYLKNLSITPDFNVLSPSNFRYVQKQNDSLLFRWLDNSNNEFEFILEESMDGEDFEEIVIIPSDRQSVKVPIGVVQNKYYRLKAVGKPGFESDYTDVVEVSESILDNKKKVLIEYRLYPNPVNNTLKVEKPDAIEEIDYEIFDLSGNILLKGSLQKNMEIDLHELAHGVYFINLKVNQNQQVFKIVRK